MLLCCPSPRQEGIAGLWKGLGPNVARNAIINAAELASYDQVKESLLATGVFKVRRVLRGGEDFRIK